MKWIKSYENLGGMGALTYSCNNLRIIRNFINEWVLFDDQKHFNYVASFVEKDECFAFAMWYNE